MATVEYWIQIENHTWDTVPHRFDRMTGQDFNAGSGYYMLFILNGNGVPSMAKWIRLQ
jgi:hypothetical protein